MEPPHKIRFAQFISLKFWSTSIISVMSSRRLQKFYSWIIHNCDIVRKRGCAWPKVEPRLVIFANHFTLPFTIVPISQIIWRTKKPSNWNVILQILPMKIIKEIEHPTARKQIHEEATNYYVSNRDGNLMILM